MAYRIVSNNYRFFVVAPVHGVVFSAESRRECETFIHGRETAVEEPFVGYFRRFLEECQRTNVSIADLTVGTVRDAFDAHYYVEDAVANYAAERAA